MPNRPPSAYRNLARLLRIVRENRKGPENFLHYTTAAQALMITDIDVILDALDIAGRGAAPTFHHPEDADS